MTPGEAEWAAMRQALDLPGPWPSRATAPTHDVEVLDVDRYDGWGVVLAFCARDAALWAQVARDDDGWRSVCGGGGPRPDPFSEGRGRPNGGPVLVRAGGGRCHPGPRWPAQTQTVCWAEILCSPAVATVVVDRPSDRRFADVAAGPGWVAVVWPEGAEPLVTALGADGEELDYLDPGRFRNS